MRYILISLFLMMCFCTMAFGATDTVRVTTTIITHDTVHVERLIVDNPEMIKRLTEPYNIKISTPKKISAWTMIAGGAFAEAFSIFNLAEGGRHTWDSRSLRETGYYEINICLSVAVITAGVSMLLK